MTEDERMEPSAFNTIVTGSSSCEPFEHVRQAIGTASRQEEGEGRQTMFALGLADGLGALKGCLYVLRGHGTGAMLHGVSIRRHCQHFQHLFALHWRGTARLSTAHSKPEPKRI